jgi:hypothetical protein
MIGDHEKKIALAKNIAALQRLAAERQARGRCRHCGGAVPCWSDYGDVEVGVRWRDLSASARRQALKRLRTPRP